MLACLPLAAKSATVVDIPAIFPGPISGSAAIWVDPNNTFVAGNVCYGAVCSPNIMGQQWGLRFDTPAGNYNLTSVSIAAQLLGDLGGAAPSATEFSLDLFAWSDALHAPTGPALFSSAPMDLASAQPDLGFGVKDFRFNMIVPLAANSGYMLQLVGDGMMLVGISQFGSAGNLELFQTSNQPDSNIAKWQDFPMTMVSQVELSAVPEPATWALFILGFGGIGASLRRRRGLALA